MSCGTKKCSTKTCRCACKWNCNCLIPRAKKTYPAFGISAKRDVKIGLHPKMYKGVAVSPAVGLYHPKFPFKCKHPTISWKRQMETKEFSLTMGGRYEGKLKEQREQLKMGRGPGTHEILQWPDDVLQKPCKTTKRNVGFGGIVPLFQPSWPSLTPGPGYSKYYPYYYIDKREREGLSCVPTFEYDGLQPRSKIEVKPWSLPCILYNVKDSRTLDAFLNKVVGKRGPYDLFTGPRDDTTIKNYFAKPKIKFDNWPKSIPGEMDKLKKKSNYYKGRWSTCPRFLKVSGIRMMLKNIALCYKDPKEPGPGHYDPKSPRKPKNMKNYPFNMNSEFIRPPPSTEIRPGPGRYIIEKKRVIEGHGWTYVFKSKAPRTKFIYIPSYSYF